MSPLGKLIYQDALYKLGYSELIEKVCERVTFINKSPIPGAMAFVIGYNVFIEKASVKNVSDILRLFYHELGHIVGGHTTYYTNTLEKQAPPEKRPIVRYAYEHIAESFCLDLIGAHSSNLPILDYYLKDADHLKLSLENFKKRGRLPDVLEVIEYLSKNPPPNLKSMCQAAQMSEENKKRLKELLDLLNSVNKSLEDSNQQQSNENSNSSCGGIPQPIKDQIGNLNNNKDKEDLNKCNSLQELQDKIVEKIGELAKNVLKGVSYIPIDEELLTPDEKKILEALKEETMNDLASSREMSEDFKRSCKGVGKESSMDEIEIKFNKPDWKVQLKRALLNSRKKLRMRRKFQSSNFLVLKRNIIPDPILFIVDVSGSVPDEYIEKAVSFASTLNEVEIAYFDIKLLGRVKVRGKVKRAKRGGGTNINEMLKYGIEEKKCIPILFTDLLDVVSEKLVEKFLKKDGIILTIDKEQCQNLKSKVKVHKNSIIYVGEETEKV